MKIQFYCNMRKNCGSKFSKYCTCINCKRCRLIPYPATTIISYQSIQFFPRTYFSESFLHPKHFQYINKSFYDSQHRSRRASCWFSSAFVVTLWKFCASKSLNVAKPHAQSKPSVPVRIQLAIKLLLSSATFSRILNVNVQNIVNVVKHEAGVEESVDNQSSDGKIYFFDRNGLWILALRHQIWHLERRVPSPQFLQDRTFFLYFFCICHEQ